MQVLAIYNMLLIWPNQAEKEQLVHALQSHRVNTLVELRRIEKAFAILGSPDVTEPMTAACKFAVTQQVFNRVSRLTRLAGSYYVNSHSLLTELRALTKNYPFRYASWKLAVYLYGMAG